MLGWGLLGTLGMADEAAHLPDNPQRSPVGGHYRVECPSERLGAPSTYPSGSHTEALAVNLAGSASVGLGWGSSC